MGKYTQMSQRVLESIGGVENITSVQRCATRLRIHYASRSKVNVDEIKAADNVVGIVDKTGQVQIIIGPEVSDAYHEFLAVSGWEQDGGTSVVADDDGSEKKNLMFYVTKLGNASAAVFMPIIPALITGGLILSIKNLMVNYFGLPVESGTAQVCLAIFSAGFSLPPIWIGWTLANLLKMEPIMGAFLGGVLVSGSISGVSGLDFLGVPIPAVEYTSSVIPVVLGVIFMCGVDRALKKVIPEAVRYFLKPLFTMIIVVPITLIVLGPLGTELSGVVGNAVTWLFGVAGVIAMPICAALYPYMVMLGLDKAMNPIMVDSIARVGYDLAIMPMGYISNLAVGGTALAVALHLENKGRRGMVASFGVTALCGVTEPAFYGALITRPRVLVGTACGAVAGGLVAGAFGLQNYVVGGCPGLLTLLFFLPADSSTGNVVLGIISGAVSIAVSFAVATVMLKRFMPAEAAA